MNKMIKMMMLGMMAVPMVASAAPTVANVTARQRYPWNGLVDIDVTVSGCECDDNHEYHGNFTLTATEMERENTLKIKTLTGKDLLQVTNGVYRIVWNALADLDSVVMEHVKIKVVLDATKIIVNFSENDGVKGVQLWEGGPFWANCNVGAERPQDYGYYFWWGDTIGYKRENDKWVATDGSSSDFGFDPIASQTYNKDYATLEREGWTKNGVLAPEHDAATVYWGSGWRMPTMDEYRALVDNCTWYRTTLNGVNGFVVIGKGAYSGVSIFMPATGCGCGSTLDSPADVSFWSSTPAAMDTESAWMLYFGEYYGGMYTTTRDSGFPIRAVADDGGSDSSSANDDSVIESGSEGSCVMGLDTRVGMVVPQATETLIFDAAWGDGLESVVAVDGVPLESASGKGDVQWTPSTTTGKKVWTLTWTSGNQTLTRQFGTLDMVKKECATQTFARVAVETKMINPRQMQVDYIVYSNLPEAEVNAVAFKDGVRSFANVVKVKTAASGQIATTVPTYTKQQFVWNIPSDWDTELDKVAIEVMAKPGLLLPQQRMTIPANGTNNAMTITRNVVPSDTLFTALMWCYAGEDPVIKVTTGPTPTLRGDVMATIVTIDGKKAVVNDQFVRPFGGNNVVFPPYEGDPGSLLDYLYGKMGYELLKGADLEYVNDVTRLGFEGSGSLNQVSKKKE